MSDKAAARRILFSSTAIDTGPWVDYLSRNGREVVTAPDGENDPSIAYTVVWHQPQGVLNRLPNLKAIFSMGAGVDHVLGDPTLPDLPVVRVVSPNLTQHMVEYIAWRVLDHHRQAASYRAAQAAGEWLDLGQSTADTVTIGFMGFGELGRAAAKAVGSLGFRINAWSRRPSSAEGVKAFSGEDVLVDFLAATDILVVLLPLTKATRGIIDYRLLSGLRRDNRLGGAVLINAGRGGLQREDDILRALDEGILKEASLDVFETEPLPASSPLWTHPRVFMTPHAAAASDPAEIAGAMLEQMDAHDRGEPLRHLVDRSAGY